MPNNPFTAHQQFESKPKRNTFDLSFQNNMTCRFGDLVPVFCKEVNPGDTMKIDAAYALKFMPMVFPVQTPIRATMHFFYVRNRNLWKNWMDFAYGNREDVTHPYLAGNSAQIAAGLFRTGGLGDYLGLPTTLSSEATSTLEFVSRDNYWMAPATIAAAVRAAAGQLSTNWTERVPTGPGFQVLSGSSYIDFLGDSEFAFVIPAAPLTYTKGVEFGRCNIVFENLLSSVKYFCRVVCARGNLNAAVNPSCFIPVENIGTDLIQFEIAEDNPYVNLELPESYRRRLSEGENLVFIIGGHTPVGESTFRQTTIDISCTFDTRIGITEAADAGVNITRLHINALPFRAYESIYNAFYRDMQNDPWTIDDVPQYNNYCTTHDDGSDGTAYHLFQRNWEKDFLTSALPSPQQGLAPLVGITSRGRLQVQREDGSVAEIQGEFDNDGTLTGIRTSAEMADPAVRDTVLRAVETGISINDFRNVNALQRWLENNIRRGLKYRDQVLANTGVDVRYDELDMPEFLGGFSRMVNISQVTQTSEGIDPSNPLGSYAGQANLFGGSEHQISHYCDEAGFIMGIMCVVPQPSYSQLLPKMFLKSTALDYFQPVFGHIGMQPISYAEVCPLQAIYESKDLTSTFGYQRPFYDLIASVDEVHGKMRTDMRDFVMNRTFAVAPELGPDFLHIDPAQVNQVFSYTDPDEHVIMGQIVFQCYKQTAVPRFGIPRLEA